MDIEHRVASLEDRILRVSKQLLRLQKLDTKNDSKGMMSFGYTATCVYVLLLAFLTRNKIPDFISGEMELNNLGDFMAGLFAPLAFLWLFVGVRIQSRELRNQIDQLTKNVEHQNDIATAAVSELDAYKPHFHIHDISLENAKPSTHDPKLFYCPTKFTCLLYTSPSPRDATLSRMPSSA